MPRDRLLGGTSTYSTTLVLDRFRFSINPHTHARTVPAHTVQCSNHFVVVHWSDLKSIELYRSGSAMRHLLSRKTP